MKRKLKIVLPLVLGLALEWIAATALFRSHSCGVVMLPHLLATALLTPPILSLAGLRWAENPKLGRSLVLTLNASLPVLGPVISTLFLELDRRLRPIPSTSQFTVGDAMDRVEQTAMDLAPISQSLTTILNSRAVSARRSAILALRAFQDAAAVHVLRRAIRDSDEQVRSYANSRLKRLIDGMESAIKELENRLLRDPGNDFIQLAMAEQMFEMVEMGLVNPENELRMLQRITDLLLAGRREQHFPEAELLALKCNLRAGFGENAQACLERLGELQYRSEALDLYRLEILFEMRDWETFHSELKAARTCNPSPQVRQLAALWLTAAEVHA